MVRSVHRILGVCSVLAPCTASTLYVEPGATPYGVEKETIKANGLVTGGPQDALLYYPAGGVCGAGQCPLISFAHGTGVGPASYDGTMREVASYGYVVVAVGSCPFKECPGPSEKRGEYEDQLHAIDACRDGTATNKPDDGKPVAALAGASFDKVGVMGHSMGGGSTVCAASLGGHGIVAGAALHPSGEPYCPAGDSPRVPMLYFGGTKDSLTPAASVVHPHYLNAPDPKAYINIKGAKHTAPMDKPTAPEGTYAARWFDCHIKRRQEACKYYFSDAGTGLCGSAPAVPITAAQCEKSGLEEEVIAIGAGDVRTVFA